METSFKDFNKTDQRNREHGIWIGLNKDNGKQAWQCRFIHGHLSSGVKYFENNKISLIMFYPGKTRLIGEGESIDYNYNIYEAI